MIDNIDSFTHNLARYFVELGETVEVISNDAISIDDIRALSPSKLVFSPGPCTPNEAGITLPAIKTFSGQIPMLGVCLGHQAIGQTFGANVAHATEIRHGKTSQLQHNGSGLFEGLPTQYNVTRYHSLVLEERNFPTCLQRDAWCISTEGKREIMGISHRTHPTWGVQFHPESLLTEYGYDVLRQFLKKSTMALA
nr:aminodeoxychorismate/anthranilate synthase component II [Alteromonas sp. 5E99-2]